MVTLKNEWLTVSISPTGAELQSVKYCGKEYMWSGNPEVWRGISPILFPICGGLKEDRYTYKGKEYILPKHGFGRLTEFEVESAEAEKAVFLLKSNAALRQNYPFDFELRIIYSLKGKSIDVDYSVVNKTDGEMYFSIGAHEGYACPGGIEDYTVVFDCEETADSNVLHGNLLSTDKVRILDSERELPLKYDYFAVDALVFLDLKSKGAVLKHNKSQRSVRVDFNGFDYFILWTKPGAEYICLEPWCGIQDFEGSDYDITKKRGIIKLKKNESFERTHTITVE